MKIVTWIFCIAALAYVIARAFCVAFTVDEAWTYLGFVSMPVWDIITAKNPAANNHILNTLLVKLNTLFSTSEFALRLPNVLAFVLFLYSYYRISGFYFSDRALRLLFLAAVTLNGALLRFFALSRGYGLAIGLLSFSFLQLIQVSSGLLEKRTGSMHLALLSAVFATYANFSVLNATIGIFLAAIYIQYHHGERRLKLLALPTLYFALLVILCAYPLYRMSTSGELYYGGINNFVDDTIASIIEDMSSYVYFKDTIYVLPATTIFIGLTLAISLYRRWKEKMTATQFIFPLILLFCIAAINLQFYLFDIRLVIHRSALYLYPIIIASFFALLSSFKNARITIYGCSILLVGILVTAFQQQAGICTISEWWLDENNKKVLSYVTTHHHQPRKIRFYGFSLTSNSFNYYIRTKYKDKIEETPCCIDDVSTIDLSLYDFLYLKKDDDVSAYPDLKPVRSYAEGNFILYEKQQ